MKTRLKRSLLGGGLIMIVLAVVFNIVSNFYSIPFFTYPNFGVQIPTGYSVLGIDISHHQHKINWKQVSAMRDYGMKVNFVFMKATQGARLCDDQFCRNWAAAKEHNLHRGAYLYFDARVDGAAQARLFIKNVRLEAGDFPPVIDFEELRHTPAALAKKRFLACAKILEAHYDVKPILYTYVNFYNTHLGEDFEQFPLWVAHYKSYGKPRIDRQWHFWQFSDKGNMDGIGSKVDFNVFNGSKGAMQELTISDNPE